MEDLTRDSAGERPRIGEVPMASLSFDLDNKWSYMKTHGDPGWEGFPSYFHLFLPEVLDLLDQLELKITFFIVGQDAALEKNQDILAHLTQRGHEVGNHSFHHDPWLHLRSNEALEEDVLSAERYIHSVTGQRPIAFRGPGFSWGRALFELLEANGYLFDATVLPTYLGPLARLYYFWKAGLTEDEKIERKRLYGGLSDGFRPVKPFYWRMATGKKILEIPVTTIPFLKAPFHLSYLLYLRRFSQSLMLGYLKFALSLCRVTKTAPSFLLHPLDFLNTKDAPELAFFPAMHLTKREKRDAFFEVFRVLRSHFALVNMSTQARCVLAKRKLRIIEVGHE